jgi:hypothetical protein
VTRTCEPVPAGARQCASLPEIEVPSAEGDPRKRPLGRPWGAPASAGQRRQPPHVFIGVRERRLDPCPSAVAYVFKAACAASVSASGCFHEHDWDPSNIPHHCEVVGTTALYRSKVAFRPGNRRKRAGSGAENTVPRHSPPRLLVTETSPQPRSLRAPLVAGTGLFPVRSDVERGRCRHAAYACKAHVATGSCGARSPRRDRTFTNPRGLPSSAVRDANGEVSFRADELPGDCVPRFFHHRGHPCEGRSRGR